MILNDALKEVRRRWGHRGMCHEDRGLCFVGVSENDTYFIVKGRGWSWEEAFDNAAALIAQGKEPQPTRLREIDYLDPVDIMKRGNRNAN